MRISEIQIGDLVLAYNEVSEENGYYPVTNVIAHQDPVIIKLTIDGDTVTTTPEHPFFTLDKGWQPSGNITVGFHIQQSDGSYGEVTAIEVVNQPQQMYNLTVDQANTFYVGDQEWLVDNKR